MRILLVEDDVRAADLIRYWLDSQAFSVTVAYTGEQGQQLSDDADLAIIDILLPDISGIDVCLFLRQKKQDIPILMLSGLGTTEDKLKAFEAGADDYVVKPCDLRELSARVKVLLRRTGQTIHKPSIQALTYGDLTMDLQTKIVTRGGKIISLTPREYGLLAYLMRNPDRIISRDEIAHSVWDTNFETKTNFIDVYINYLRNKMDRDFPVKLIHTKSGMGILFSTAQ